MKSLLQTLRRSLRKIIGLVADDWKIPTGVGLSAVAGIFINILYSNSAIAGLVYVIGILTTFVLIVFIVGIRKTT